MAHAARPGPAGTIPSSRVGEAAARARLGGHLAAYIPQPVETSSRLPALGVVTALAAVLLVIGFATGTPVLFVIALPVTLLLGVRFARELYMAQRNENVGKRRANSELHLFQGGLVVIVNGGLLRAFRWDSVSVLQDIVNHISNGVHRYTSYAYTLHDGDGPDIQLKGGFPRPEEWGPEVQRAVTGAQLPRARAEVRQGRTLSFGDISVNVESVTAKGRTVPWAHIDEIRVRDGSVSLKVSGKWRSLTATTVNRIPNFFIFYALAEELQNSAHPS